MNGWLSGYLLHVEGISNLELGASTRIRQVDHVQIAQGDVIWTCTGEATRRSEVKLQNYLAVIANVLRL